MNLLAILLLGIALSLDTFAVSLTLGLLADRTTHRQKVRFLVVIGLFHFLMIVIGWFMGETVSRLIADYDHWIAFGLLLFIGGKMIQEGLSARGDSVSGSDLLSLRNTLLLFCLIPLCLLLGLGLALIMDQGLRGTALFRTLILLPFALSFVVTGTVWAYMYRPTGGVLNSFLSILGVDVSAAMKAGHLMWASSNSTIMLSIIIAMVWQFSGYVAVIFLAAIKNVPVNVINAAKLDGAYMPRIYFKLIIPQLKGAMGSCITILAMYALRSFDFIVSLVGYTTSAAWTLPIWMYNEAFQNNNFAYSAAISCFLLALVLVLILPLTYWTNRRK